MSASTSEDQTSSFENVKAQDHNTGEGEAERQVGKEETVQPAPAPTGPPPPPNGGTVAWLQVVGGPKPEQSTTMRQKITKCQHLLPGALPIRSSSVGGAFDGGHFYPVVSLGIFLEVFGMMMTSLGTKYYQIFLAQGLCVGLGSGCLFTPAISLVGTYFSTRRALATGIAASGSSVGGVIFPIIIRRLIVTVGFPWAVRTMAFIMLAILGIGIALLRPRLPPRKSGPIIDLAAFKDPAYTTFVIGLALGFMAFFIPFFYAESYALNIGADTNISFYLLSIMNAAGMIGRLLPNAIADKVGSLNVIIPCAFLSGIIILSWISVHHLGNLIATSVFYSFFSGGLMALPPSVLVALSPNLAQIGVRVGMALSVSSLGVLIGSPIAGAILSSQSRSNGPDVPGALDYTGTLAFTGVVLLVCGVFMTGTRVIKKGFRLEKV
ncbi:Riboflavin transporter MCH5 [Talaromyces pinophilus]|nr:Riboflavin transporter MCH5 [Talaromyces pinophilus]